MPTAPKTENRYKILHTQVGPWPKDRVVSEAEIKEHTKNIGRLLNLGAIQKTKAPLTKDPLPPGPYNDEATTEETNAPLNETGKKNANPDAEDEAVTDEAAVEEDASESDEEVVEEEPVEEEAASDPSTLSLPALKTRARILQIANYQKMNRDQLVKAIGEAQAD